MKPTVGALIAYLEQFSEDDEVKLTGSPGFTGLALDTALEQIENGDFQP